MGKRLASSTVVTSLRQLRSVIQQMPPAKRSGLLALLASLESVLMPVAAVAEGGKKAEEGTAPREDPQLLLAQAEPLLRLLEDAADGLLEG